MENNAAEAEVVAPVEDVNAEPEQLDSNEADVGLEATEVEPEDTEGSEPEWFKKRFDKITAQKYAEKARADALEAELKKLREAQPQNTAVAPNVEEFDNMEEWNTAMTRFVQEQVAAGVESKYREIQQSTQTQSQQAAEQQELLAFRQREAEFAAANPGYYDLAHNQALPVSEAMAAEIRGSDKGPQLLLHLAKNPQLAAQLAQLPGHQAAAELGRLELSLSAKPKPKSTKAPPPPVTNSGGSADVSKDPSKMTPEEYRRWRLGR